MQAVRVDTGHQVTDMLDGKSFVDGELYTVTFPDGSIETLPAIVKSEGIIRKADPPMIVREQAFFAIEYCGLTEVWARAIDLPNIEVGQVQPMPPIVPQPPFPTDPVDPEPPVVEPPIDPDMLPHPEHPIVLPADDPQPPVEPEPTMRGRRRG